MQLRRLNDLGLERFEDWLDAGAPGSTPVELLTSPATSSIASSEVKVSAKSFGSRFELGQYLTELMTGIDSATISNDRNLWSGLALLWFDQLCPPYSTGRRLDKSYRYILSSDYRHYYRHLVRTPWQLVRDHGDRARLLLLPQADTIAPLRRHGEVLEQLGGRQSVLRSQSLIAEANRLYADPSSGRPKKGVAGSGRGSVRRLALVLRQLDLTYDIEKLPDGKLIAILPREFERWRINATV